MYSSEGLDFGFYAYSNIFFFSIHTLQPACYFLILTKMSIHVSFSTFALHAHDSSINVYIDLICTCRSQRMSLLNYPSSMLRVHVLAGGAVSRLVAS